MNPPPAPKAIALPPGTRLGEFELQEVIAVGGFGIVYRARDWSLQREVAIKEYMPSSLAGRTEGMLIGVTSESGREHFEIGVRSFINEAQLLARFDHPSLLKVYRFWEANGTAYMAMPLLRGQLLKAVQRFWSPAGEDQLRALLRPLLEALAVLHGEGVYHRDISPDNISIEPGGQPVLMDFGAARLALHELNQTMTVILKPSYAPIEQYANADTGPMRQGPWTDLYALGATLYFLLKGTPPPAATSRAVNDTMQPLAGQLLPGCSSDFLACIDWMLAPSPAERPQNVASLWQQLFGDAPMRVHGRVANFSVPDPVPPSGFGAGRVEATEARASIPDDWAPFADLFRAPVASAPAKSAASQPAAPDAGPSARSGDSLLTRLGRFFRWREHTPRAPSASALLAPSSDPEGRTLLLPVGPLDSAGGPLQPLQPADTTVILRAAAPPVANAQRGLALIVLRCDVSSFVGQMHMLPLGETIIGRAASGLSIADPGLSIRHARIQIGPGGAELTDLGSTNGTWVNGVRVPASRPLRLILGAHIQMGTTLLSLSRPGPLPLPDLGGQLIDGRYELKACLHTSPKGVLYSAHKQSSGVEVVVKVLSPDYAADATYRSRFADEARIAARLQHPHICRLDDHGETTITLGGESHRVPFAAYPILGGGNLAQRAAEFGSLSPETIERWVQSAASALAYAHGAGMVHGNLKPSALCFDSAANLYITDFAGSGAGADGAALFGTPGFTAPEQWRGESLQPASDQYALAAITYYMLTGSRPHDALADPSVREQATAPPPAAHLEAQRRFGRRLSPAVSTVLNQALAAEPSARFPDVERFARDLAQALRRGRSAHARQVFISYRRDDSAILATYIAERLEQRHEITSFVDVQGLDGAVRFPARIERAIADCEVFVCILGHQTLQSPHVRRELALAAEQGKPMIPVFQESYVMPDESEIDAAIGDLLQYDGIQLLDKRNIFVQAAVDELALQVRKTIERNAR